MDKIITLQQIQPLINRLKSEGKSIVLVGGCFDIFHYGHFHFLKEAKKLADILIIALEHDDKVKRLKGDNRPITPQPGRAELLAAFEFVDYVLRLPLLLNHEDYFHRTTEIAPNVIAVTEGDRQIETKKKQAREVGGKVVAIAHFNTPSTSELVEIIRKEE